MSRPVKYAVVIPVEKYAWESNPDVASDLRYEAVKLMQQKGLVVSDIKMDVVDAETVHPAMAPTYTWDGREITPPKVLVRFQAELIPNELGLKEIEEGLL
ncbi:hypothetical protein A5630_25245 [Mycolicibacterium mucogenicum]|uniref:Uncharacterized protein n=1 Tax=Mycolicibacterium mucogenicum TaxID=56689 RepID=A0A1A3GY37_MYCMU|nr:hypothetical protein [Mycolicibacterium mucogenicum]OBJ40259.1 hypothetical protein A5630_25245 [Mycolicibacterium mucogenicum]